MWSEWGGDFGKKEKSINYQFTFSTSSTLKHGSTHIAYEIFVNSAELESIHTVHIVAMLIKRRKSFMLLITATFETKIKMENLMQFFVFFIN